MKKIISKKSVLIFLSLAFILVLYFILKPKNNKNLYVKDYSYIEVKKSNIVGNLKLNGMISANNPVGIFVDKKLKVKEVLVKNGDFIEKNQLLISFDDDEKNKLERAIEKEKINLNKIKRNLKITQELYKIGGISLEELRNLQDSYKISQLNIDEYTEILNKTAKEIRSPVDGVISNLKAQKNYLVDTDSPLMEIIDSNDLKIVVEIPEYNSTMVKLGDEVKLTLDISEDKKMYDAFISKISKLSTISNLTSENVLEAEIQPKEKINNLVPGFKVKASLDLKVDKEEIIIPKISLLHEKGKYFVYVLDKSNKLNKREIEVKNISGDNIIVTSALNEGEKIIETPDNRLKDGLKLLEGEIHW